MWSNNNSLLTGKKKEIKWQTVFISQYVKNVDFALYKHRLFVRVLTSMEAHTKKNECYDFYTPEILGKVEKKTVCWQTFKIQRSLHTYLD